MESKNSKELNSNEFSDEHKLQPHELQQHHMDSNSSNSLSSPLKDCNKIENVTTGKGVQISDETKQHVPEATTQDSFPTSPLQPTSLAQHPHTQISSMPEHCVFPHSTSELDHIQPTLDTDIEHENDDVKVAQKQSPLPHSSTLDRIQRLKSVTPSPTKNLLEPTDDKEDFATTSTSTASPINSFPKLRLNTLLASDPALKPDAKDVKTLHMPLAHGKRDAQLLEPLTLVNSSPPPPQGMKQQQSAVVKPPAKPRIKVFMCLPCGISFSSASTLEAHQAYYCSHRNKDADEDSSLPTTDNSTQSTEIGRTGSGATLAYTSGTGNVEPLSKVLRTTKQYACSKCSYSADKKVSLNRHMRMHQTSPTSSLNSVVAPSAANGAAALDDSSSQIDRYCSNCDIRFNNVKTYRAHKQHYCSSRRTDDPLTLKLESSRIGSDAAIKTTVGISGTISPHHNKTPTPRLMTAATEETPILQPHPQPFLALPTNPIIIIPCSLLRMASLLPNPLSSVTSESTNPESTCFTLENGVLKPLATTLSINTMTREVPASVGITTNSGTQMQHSEAPRQKHLQQSHQQQSQQLSQCSTEQLPEKSIINCNTESEDSSNNVVLGTSGMKRKEGRRNENAPLDLSLRRSPISVALQRQRLSATSCFLDAEQQEQQQYVEIDKLLEVVKENLLAIDESGSITPEHIVCAPSLPNSPSMSPSPKRRVMSPRSSGPDSSSSMSPPTSLPSAVSASMLPADLALKLSEAKIINPLLTKQSFELALQLSAAAAAVNTVAGSSSALVKSGAMMMLSGASGGAAVNSGVSPGQPQIYVKQGVSKCKECNIVFCKYENYLAHKQHYCSSRNQDSSNNVESDVSKISSTSPIVTNVSTAEAAAPVAYQQLICAACGIKYTSLDTLRAHQNYYCPKGSGATAAGNTGVAMSVAEPKIVNPTLSTPAEKCTKCKIVHEVGTICPITTTPVGSNSASGGGQNIYKCPVCDVVSLTASESRKHMEVHGSIKAFRCTICGYKGNKLRGMRAHIRMHFDKKTFDCNEEHYMDCILEDDGIEIPSAASFKRDEDVQQLVLMQQQQQLQLSSQVHNCDICNYSSSYKGNVLRHMKLVHLNSSSPSISPNANMELDFNEPPALASSLNEENSSIHSFTVKTEPHDHCTSLSAADNINSPVPPSGSSPLPSNDIPDIMTFVKSEPLDVNVDVTLPTLQKTPPSSPMLPTQATSPLLPPPPPPTQPLNVTSEENEFNETTAAAAAAAAALNQKYCQTCDISFNYMKTYLAHKQYYCKNKMLATDINNVVMVTAAGKQSPNASSTLLLEKNKENMKQEATI